MKKEREKELNNFASIIAGRMMDFFPLNGNSNLTETILMLQDVQMKVSKMKNLVDIERARRNPAEGIVISEDFSENFK